MSAPRSRRPLRARDVANARVTAIGCARGHSRAETATDEEVRALWVSMAQTWTKLAQATERLQPHQAPRGDGDSPKLLKP
jgi:hypothetical protein